MVGDGGYRDSSRSPRERATLTIRWRAAWRSIVIGGFAVAIGVRFGAHPIFRVVAWLFAPMGVVLVLAGFYRLVQRTKLVASPTGLERWFAPLPPSKRELLPWSEVAGVSVESNTESGDQRVVVERSGARPLRLIRYVGHDGHAAAIATAVYQLAEYFEAED